MHIDTTSSACGVSNGMVRRSDLDGPYGLDRMFWKEKGAFILGCSSPFKAIMIDRPGMGKVKSCIAKRKEPEKRSEGKRCEPGEAWERLVLIIKL